MGVFCRAQGNRHQSSVVATFSDFRTVMIIDVNSVVVFWDLVVSSTLKTEAADSTETLVSPLHCVLSHPRCT